MKKQHFFGSSLIIIAVLAFLGYMLLSSFGGKASQSTKGLEIAQNAEIVELKDGDVYDLEMTYVKKNINGKDIRMMAYNGSIPGPTIKVKQGSTVTVNLINKSDIPTTLHSHGIRMENQYDGVPHMTQNQVDPGESFKYKLNFQDAGVFWYHPHIHEEYAQNIGAYGNFLVTSNDPNYLSPVNKEIPLMISDILLGPSGTPSFDIKNPSHILMGRYGNVYLVNGTNSYTSTVKSGDVIRYFLTNASNARPLRIAIPGAQIKLVGADNGKLEREVFIENVTIGPSERAIIDVYFPKSGNYTLENSTPAKSTVIGNIIAVDGVDDFEGDSISYYNKFKTLRTNYDVIKDIDSYRNSFNKVSDKKITLFADIANMEGMHHASEGMQMLSGPSKDIDLSGGKFDGIEWEDEMMVMNSASNKDFVKWNIRDDKTGAVNEKINWAFKKGDQVKIEIYNDPKSPHPMQHPFHIHGNRFLVLSENGIKNTNMVWKDTANVPIGSRVDILLDASNIGDWMAHCHISEHLVGGMMFNYSVIE